MSTSTREIFESEPRRAGYASAGNDGVHLTVREGDVDPVLVIRVEDSHGDSQTVVIERDESIEMARAVLEAWGEEL